MFLVALLLASSVAMLAVGSDTGPAGANDGIASTDIAQVQARSSDATVESMVTEPDPTSTAPEANLESTATPEPDATPDVNSTMTPSSSPDVTSTPPPETKDVPESIAATQPTIPEARKAQLASFAPTGIQIPRFGVDARVIPVGINEQGAMDTPRDFSEVAWYQYGATPGERGRAVLAGHVDSYTGPAVFYKLGSLEPGDEIVIHRGPGQPVRFVVREIASYRTDLAPVDRIFGDSEKVELILITCGGPFDRAARQYLERVVVYAELAEQVVQNDG